MYYLKYRPQKFSELFGLEEISQSLQKALAKNQISHAYIFTGPKGSGKTTTARILAKALNCEKLGYVGQGLESRNERLVGEKKLASNLSTLTSEPEPCNQCSTCRAINEGRYLDLIEIDAASNRGIDDIRELRDKIKLSPSQGKFKVYIVDEAHMLTREAFNALLKTLEEPPLHAIFILATTEFHKIPETIKSRCQVLNFKRGRRQDIIKKLDYIGHEEKVKVSPADLSKIADLAEGGFRNAETLLEQLVVGEVNLKTLKLTPAHLIELLLRGETAPILEEISKMVEAGQNISDFSRQVVAFLRLLLLFKSGVSLEKMEVDQEEADLIKKLASRLSRVQLVYMLEKFLAVSEQEKYSPLPQLPLEVAVLDLSEYLAGEKKEDNRVEVKKEESNPGPTAGSKLSQDLREEKRPKANVKIGNLTLSSLKEHWNDFLKAIKPLNHSLEALLRSARPKGVDEQGVLTIEVFYKFHKEKLSQSENLDLVQKAVAGIFGQNPRVEYVLGQKPEVKPLGNKDGQGNDKTGQAGPEDLVEAALEAFGS